MAESEDLVKAANAEAARWRAEAARWEQQAKANEALQRELREARECIATLRAARWTARPTGPAEMDAIKAATAAAGISIDEAQERCRRSDVERALLARELHSTEDALQHASASAIALGAKAEHLLQRLAQSTALSAQQTTAQILNTRSTPLAPPAPLLPSVHSAGGASSKPLMPSGPRLALTESSNVSRMKGAASMPALQHAYGGSGGGKQVGSRR